MNSAEKTVVIATGNAHKVEEFNRLAADAGLKNVRFISAKDCVPGGMPHVVEDSGTFEGNARLKAIALRKIVPENYFVMADDSGLCVDILNGAPGVETAYYAGPDATHAENRAKLVRALDGIPPEKRGAHFYCLLFLITPENEEKIFDGACQGFISENERDAGFGFGYDPVFLPAGYDKTFAELSGEIKDRLSHRGNAFAALTHYFANDAEKNRLPVTDSADAKRRKSA